MYINNSKEKHCDYNNFRKARYFDGEILDKNIFIAEQKYHNDKRKLLNKMLHGWGVVCGLKVKATNPPSSNIIVEPGLALDCHGNEILVCEEQTVDLSSKTCIQKIETNPCLEESSASNDTALYVVIKYQEINSDPVPSYAPSGNCEEKACDYSRTREGFCIEVWDKLPPTPKPDNTDLLCSEPFKCPTCCPDPHYIVLATIKCGERTYMFFSNDTIELNGKTAAIHYRIKRVLNEVCISSTNHSVTITDTFGYQADPNLTDIQLIESKENLGDKFEIVGEIKKDPNTDNGRIYDVKAKQSGSANLGVPMSLSYSLEGNAGTYNFDFKTPIYVGKTEPKYGSAISDTMIRNTEDRQVVVTYPFLSWLLNCSGSKEGQLFSYNMNSFCELMEMLFYSSNMRVEKLERQLTDSRADLVNLQSAMESIRPSEESEKKASVSEKTKTAVSKKSDIKENA